MHSFITHWIDSLMLKDLDLKQHILKALVNKNFINKERLYIDTQMCKGLLFILDGKARIFSLSKQGREIDLFYIYSKECCILSANCVYNSVEMDIILEFMQDTKTAILPSSILHILKDNIIFQNFLTHLLTKRLSQTITTLNITNFKSLSYKFSQFALKNMQNNSLYITHQELSNHLGSTRESLTRLLKKLEKQGIVKNLRKEIKIQDIDALKNLN